MDALAGYGSDSDSDEENKSPGGGGLSGLLDHYSDDSDVNANNGKASHQNGANLKAPEDSSSINGEDSGKVDKAEETIISSGDNEARPARKRKRRWDNPNEDPIITVNIDAVLPPPTLRAASADKGTNDGHQIGTDNSFQSTLLFQKDYTKELRQKLSQQLQNQSQGKEASSEMHQLNKKLEQLYDKLQGERAEATDVGGTASAPSFAAHLKSQKEFGNPHLLKSIIEHYSLNPLESHAGGSFSRFEYADRLASAEERARIAAANYDAGAGASGGGVPDPGA